MKTQLALVTLLTLNVAQAAVKGGSCKMGTGDAQVQLNLVIDGVKVTMAYEGDDDGPTMCELQADQQSDYNILCKGEDSEDNITVTIKGSSGRMLDSEGSLVSELKNCRIR